MFDKLNAFRPEQFSKWIVLGLATCFCYYKYLTWNYGVFKKLGIKGPKPVPGFGNLLEFFKNVEPKYDLELKQTYGSVVGWFIGRRPYLLIYDTDMLKQILIKRFNIFPNRLNIGILDPPTDQMVFLLKDDHWRHVRGILTPSFSSGKLRKMSDLINKCCDSLCTNLKRKADSGEVFDLREISGAFTMDTIASTAFGIKIDSQNDSENAFVKNANKLFRLKMNLSTLVYFFLPFLYKPLTHIGLGLTDASVLKFFSDVMHKAIAEREKDHNQMDFLQIMLNAHLEDQNDDNDDGGNDSIQKSSNIDTKIKKGLTSSELLAQGFLFFFAGFETVGNAIGSFGHSMATNADIQEKLYEEIVEKLGKDEEPNYDILKEFVYLDMCLSENLRMYPGSARSDRVASEDVRIGDIFIPKGMAIGIPTYALHHDPEYWNEPEKFDPERFSPTARQSIDPLHYMPFGLGPRNCVGMRLALMEIKMAIIKMIRKFKFQACQETEVPMSLDPTSLRSRNGIKIKVIERS